MILQALTRYYEILLKRGKIAASGWAKAKVSWALELSADGSPLLLLPLQQEVQRGKKTLSVPQELEVPAPVKRTVGVAANFLCDNSGYLLGADAKGNPERTADCFAAAKALHLNLLASVDSPAARAVTAFFERWDPAQAASCPALQQDWAELIMLYSINFSRLFLFKCINLPLVSSHLFPIINIYYPFCRKNLSS